MIEIEWMTYCVHDIALGCQPKLKYLYSNNRVFIMYAEYLHLEYSTNINELFYQ